jgi:hypothetical protein
VDVAVIDKANINTYTRRMMIKDGFIYFMITK